MNKRLVIGILTICLALSLLACGGKGCGGTDSKQDQGQMTWQEQYDLGIRLLGEGKYEQAILAFQAAIKIDPKNEDAYIGLIEVYKKKGDKDRAITILQDAFNNCDDVEKLEKEADRLGIHIDGNGGQQQASKQENIAEEIAGLTRHEKLDYYFSKGNNARHWVFENNVIFNGHDCRTLLVKDIVAMSPALGWGEMQYVGVWQYTDTLSTAHTDSIDGHDPFAFVEEPNTNFDGSLCFHALYVGDSIGSEQNDHIEAMLAMKPATGIFDIRLGDSFTSVLEAFGYEYAQEISDIILQDSEETIGESSDTYIRRVSARKSSNEYEYGEKKEEELWIELRESEGIPFLSLRVEIWVEGSCVSYTSLHMYFDSRDDYTLKYCLLANEDMLQ